MRAPLQPLTLVINTSCMHLFSALSNTKPLLSPLSTHKNNTIIEDSIGQSWKAFSGYT